MVEVKVILERIINWMNTAGYKRRLPYERVLLRIMNEAHMTHRARAKQWIQLWIDLGYLKGSKASGLEAVPDIRYAGEFKRDNDGGEYGEKNK